MYAAFNANLHEADQLLRPKKRFISPIKIQCEILESLIGVLIMLTVDARLSGLGGFVIHTMLLAVAERCLTIVTEVTYTTDDPKGPTKLTRP